MSIVKFVHTNCDELVTHLHPNSTFEIRARKNRKMRRKMGTNVIRGVVSSYPFDLSRFFRFIFWHHFEGIYHNFITICEQIILEIESIVCALYSLRNYWWIFDKK